MRKDKVVFDRKTWDELCEHKRNLIDDYCHERNENKKLQNENGYLKALFDKEGDTDVIRYNGKLYRIITTTHYKDVDASDTLDITAALVSEVG